MTSDPIDDSAYKAAIAKWRASVEADLKSDEGWLNVAGLFWLKPGSNPIGSSADASVRLPATVSGPDAGSIEFANGHITLHASPALHATLNGSPVTDITLRPESDKVHIGAVSFKVIVRGSRTGVRLFDPNCKERQEFKGEKWFSVQEQYRIVARFVPYDPPHTLQITNVLGDTSPSSCPGYIDFTFNGKDCRLDAQSQGSGLFLNFQDLTTGKSTYPAGRFLDTDAPHDGFVTVDFNRATNPPCAWTAFATCPLPPAGNLLPVAIRAGEKTHPHPKE
jgi:uncharacterized protein (DUF1684 family)